MDNSAHAPALRALAGSLKQRSLDGAARFFLGIISPLDIIASQVAIFARPFAPEGRWQQYVTALEDEQSWAELRAMLEASEC